MVHTIVNDLFSSSNIVRVIKWGRMRWAGHVAHMGRGEAYIGVLMRKPEGKRALGRPRLRWQDNTMMNLQEE
jgi:hypothetical protein